MDKNENKILLHTCCAPCSIKCVETLREEGVEPVIYWYNPNIHPYTEYRNRRDALRIFTGLMKLELIEEGSYALRDFLAALPSYDGERCGTCYDMRLDAAARYAAAHDYCAFSTTLLISPYQNHELLISTANAKAEKYGVNFLYRDFRPRFREGQAAARELGLYMQKYCGCVFSEEERYIKKK